MKKLKPNVMEGKVLSLPDIFTSVGHLVDELISVVEEEGVGVFVEE